VPRRGDPGLYCLAAAGLWHAPGGGHACELVRGPEAEAVHCARPPAKAAAAAAGRGDEQFG